MTYLMNNYVGKNAVANQLPIFIRQINTFYFNTMPIVFAINSKPNEALS